MRPMRQFGDRKNSVALLLRNLTYTIENVSFNLRPLRRPLYGVRKSRLGLVAGISCVGVLNRSA